MSLFYIKNSIGKNRKNIPVIKFRTMCENAEIRLEEVIQENGLGAYGKVNNDSRILSDFHYKLRDKHYDEWPQLLNILLGHMRLIGIRPKTYNDWKSFPEELKEKSLKYKPGLLGVQYAYETNSFRASILTEFLYLEEKKERPIFTDIKFGSRVVYNRFIKRNNLYQLIFKGFTD